MLESQITPKSLQRMMLIRFLVNIFASMVTVVKSVIFAIAPALLLAKMAIVRMKEDITKRSAMTRAPRYISTRCRLLVF